MKYKTLNSSIFLYGLVWLGSVLYGIYKVSKASSVFFKEYNDAYNDFTQGWSILNSKKDISDDEWTTVIETLKILSPWIVLHIFITEKVPVFQIIISLICILNVFGVFVLCLIILQPVLFIFVSKFKNKFATWLFAGLCLLAIHPLKYEEYFQLLHIKLNIQHFVLIATLCWINLRCISISLDGAKHWTHFLWYTIYLPSLAVGPIVPYTDFCTRHRNVKLLQRCNSLALNLCRFFGWLIITEFCLHFIYVNALEFQEKFVETFDSWTLYGYGYTMGQYFHLKYVVVYGISTTVMKFEGINAPNIPKCIGRIHLYSDMWKYFDEGLYRFLKRYIYIPVNKTFKIPMLSTFLCFVFVYIWHGLQDFVFIWSFLNFIGIVIERSCGYFLNNIHYRKTVRFIGPNLERHFLCIISIPLLAMSCISNFYFFAGMGIGNIFMKRILQDSVLTKSILASVLYCCCQISTELRKKSTTSVKHRFKEFRSDFYL